MHIQQYRDITIIVINGESKKDNKQEWYQQNGEIGGSPLITLSATIIRKLSTDKIALWEIWDPSWRLWNPHGAPNQGYLRPGSPGYRLGNNQIFFLSQNSHFYFSGRILVSLKVEMWTSVLSLEYSTILKIILKWKRIYEFSLIPESRIYCHHLLLYPLTSQETIRAILKFGCTAG